MQVPLRMRRRKCGAREWLAGAVTLRGRRECGQARDDRKDRHGMIANIHSMLNIHSLARSSRVLQNRHGAAAAALPGSIVCPNTHSYTAKMPLIVSNVCVTDELLAHYWGAAYPNMKRSEFRIVYATGQRVRSRTTT